MADTFWSHVDRSGECWKWVGGLQRRKYGFWKDPTTGKTRLAHLEAWTRAHGPIPSGQFVLQICTTPGCVRPDPSHHRLGGKADHTRCINTGIRRHPPSKGHRRLNPVLVRRIRQWLLGGTPIKEIADHIKRPYATVYQAAHRWTWKHLTD